MIDRPILRSPAPLPPSGQLILIEINGHLHRARRTSHITRLQTSIYLLLDGTIRVGQFNWTHL